MNVQSKISFILASFMLTSAFAAGPKGRRAQQEEQRIPTAVCAIQTETIAALPTKEIPRPNQNNSMVQLLRKIQAVMLYDHMTAKPAHMLTLKPLDTVVMIQDLPEYGGRAINYSTKETAEFYMVTPIDALAGTEMFALVSRPDALEQGQVYIARYKHFLAIPEMGMNMAVLVDERRQNNHIFSRRATLVVGAQDGQASVSLNCNAGAGGRFTFANITRL